MSDTFVRQVDEPVEAEVVPDFQRKRQPGLLWRALTVISSLRVAVWMFALCILLVFFSTMAMVDQCLHTVLQTYFRSWGFVWVPFQIFVRFGQVFLGFPHSWRATGSFPFFSGWMLGAALMTNLLVAHFTRFRLSWKRAGVLVLHTGILVLMVSEFITGQFSIEATMTIPNGGSSNYVELADSRELAFTDSSDPKADDVVAIPGPMLKTGRLVQDPLLPVDVKIDQYMPNADLLGVTDGTTNGPGVIKAEDGSIWRLAARDEVRGVDGDRTDVPSALVTFYKKGTQESLGSVPLSFWFNQNFGSGAEFAPQKLTVGDKTYTVQLRRQRSYKPYSIHLKEFHHDIYPGTDIPKNFSSQVQVIDPATGENRQANISMNEPMFYAGETFYQQGFLPGDTGTILQVVHNPGKWFKNISLPYLGCFLVALGMLVHFGLHLIQFLVRRLAL